MKDHRKNRSAANKPEMSFVQRRKLALASFIAAMAVAFFIYSPGLRGDFVLDDFSLPLGLAANQQPLSIFLKGLRPVLMLSYWVNGRLWGDAPVSYHVVNVLIHLANSGLVFLVLNRLLLMAAWPVSRSKVAAAVGALVFLIHPLQTESVSYIAGRSESLAALFLLLAYTLFLYRRRQSISWPVTIAVLLLFALAVKTKENAVSLAGILFLTDIMWPKPFSWEGPRKNWRLYSLMLPGVLVAAALIFRMLATAGSAGFSAATFKWYQYAFTEARAIFTYVRLAILPIGQSLDHDFATSHTIFEHGAIVYIALLGGLVAAAVLARRRFPLACFGLLMFLIWLAPTSSIVPIDDALVERRMYLPLLGLILVGCDAVDRLKLTPRAIGMMVAPMVLVFGGFCYARNRLWGQPESLLAQAAVGARHNPRPLLNLAEILIRHNRCELAVPFLDRAQRILPNNYFVNVSWGRTAACLGHPDEGLRMLQAAAQINPCSQVYEWIGFVYGQMGKLADARDAFQKSVQLDPRSASAHSALAFWYESVHDLNSAEREYRISLDLNPEDWTARASLERLCQLKNNPAPQLPPPGISN